MISITLKRTVLLIIIGFSFPHLNAQKLLPFRLSDSGQTGRYTSTPGEDADYLINPPSLTDNRDGTITDNNSFLMWQKIDGGEMTFDSASQYCRSLRLGGYSDWRLPTSIELFSINNYNNLNPALDSSYFTKTNAQYWWTSEKRADDSAVVWVVNAGGGIGPHPQTETLSAGGTRIFCTRAVRDLVSTQFHVPHFTDNGDGTITDNNTGLVWQKIQPPDSMTWDDALVYSKTVFLRGKTDWRLPNVKELQSLNDVSLINPSFNKNYFPNITSGTYWTSTTLFLTESKAWDINLLYGIVSYNDKTSKENVLLVRGGLDNKDMNITEVTIPGGEYEMGDHNGHYDPGHPDDEIPIHLVKIDSMSMSTTETTNEQYLSYLNSALLAGSIQVTNNRVHLKGDTSTLYYTYQDANYYSIGYDGNEFYIADFRTNHPVVGVMWIGAAAFCNWLSVQNGLQPCYDLTTWDCDFNQNGYRLPTEAEWEYAGRGGHTDPYLKYPNLDTIDITQANLPNSGDPYETGAYPYTTPVGFYNGSLRLKSDYNWPGSASSYQTSNGINGFGLYDIQGNVWEFVWDWYGENYYSYSPFDNPKGPDTGSMMSDGKPYRGMRGGNWYNGIDSNGVNDGHSRVSNRDPSYYRGPLDPYNPWYHVGFRFMRKYSYPLGVNDPGKAGTETGELLQNYPNPFSRSTTLRYFVPVNSHITLKVTDIYGQTVSVLIDEDRSPGWYTAAWDGSQAGNGVYFCIYLNGGHQSAIKMILIK
jgi:formylglycine-generating enzyme required for sulfatase activity